MRHKQNHLRQVTAASRRGAALVLIAILLPVMLLLSAIANNYCYMDLCRTELYTAVDAATRASGREFTVSRSQSQAILKGQQIAELNTVAGENLTLSSSDFTFGQSTRAGLTSRYAFDSGSQIKNSVQIIGKRDSSSADNSIPLILPGILGRSSFDLNQTAISTAVEVDIALVLDRSGSMAYAADEAAVPFVLPYSAPPDWEFCDPAPPICRWRNLVAAVDVFLGEVSSSPISELVSLSTYHHAAGTDVSLTDNYSSILAALQPYTDSFCSGGTNIGGGINEGLGSLFSSPMARQHAVKVIVVMTDGIHNTGTYPTGPAATAAADGIVIYTVTFAMEADQGLMQSVAATGGGRHFHAASPADLINAFQAIARGLPSLLTK